METKYIDPNIIEVVYALPEYQHKFKVDLRDYSDSKLTIQQAITDSGILEYYPEIDLGKNKVGINSEFRDLNDTVEQYDRIEIYRPLKIDPMEARRLRAMKQKAKKAEG